MRIDRKESVGSWLVFGFGFWLVFGHIMGRDSTERKRGIEYQGGWVVGEVAM